MREIGLNLSQLDEGGRDLSDQLVVFSAVTLKNLLHKGQQSSTRLPLLELSSCACACDQAILIT
jgi:hypothetical protein